MWVIPRKLTMHALVIILGPFHCVAGAAGWGASSWLRVKRATGLPWHSWAAHPPNHQQWRWVPQDCACWCLVARAFITFYRISRVMLFHS
jgi:hypothetical protein